MTFLALFAGCSLASNALASPVLRCHVEIADTVQILNFAPETDPYTVRPVNIGDRFDFKAVVIGNGGAVDYVSLYVYDKDRAPSVLLHQANYPAPVAQSAPAASALTGVNFVYSRRLGRELKYACALHEVAP